MTRLFARLAPLLLCLLLATPAFAWNHEDGVGDPHGSCDTGFPYLDVDSASATASGTTATINLFTDPAGPTPVPAGLFADEEGTAPLRGRIELDADGDATTGDPSSQDLLLGGPGLGVEWWLVLDLDVAQETSPGVWQGTAEASNPATGALRNDITIVIDSTRTLPGPQVQISFPAVDGDGIDAGGGRFIGMTLDSDGRECDLVPDMGAGSISICEVGEDFDVDGWCDEDDNCPEFYNPGQYDNDDDGIGDACDAGCDDADLDTICDENDNCPEDPNLDQNDINGDGIGDACDTSSPGCPTGINAAPRGTSVTTIGLLLFVVWGFTRKSWG
jgi:hypothetical protein